MSTLFHVNKMLPNKPHEPSNCYSGLGQPFGALPTTPARVEKAALLRTASVPGPESRKRVVVVGAGISGLRAASILYQNGIDVVVVEARDRIGGRIFTSRKDGYAKDIGTSKKTKLLLTPNDRPELSWAAEYAAAFPGTGAAWMHETSQNNLVKLIPKLGIEYYYDDGIPLYYTEHGRAGSQFKAKKVADEFADYLEWYYDVNPDAADRPVSEFVEEFVKDHLLITEDERAWAPQAVREVELWIGTSVEQASSKHLSYFVTERNLYMKGGYDRVIQWTAEPLMREPEMIRLQHVVENVEWSEDGPATVRCKDVYGTMHDIVGDAVVMTLPLGVYHHNLVSFDPPLPTEIQAGHDSFSYGALGKVFFEFEEMFWSKDNDQLIYLPTPESISPHNPDSILSFATVTINLWIMSGHKVLCVQIAEPLTQRIEAMTSGAEVYKFFEPLFKCFRTEPYKALPKLLNVETTHWTQDPYAGYGTYSADKVGDDSDLLHAALEARKGSKLQFAGEHTTMVANGCVHGAFSTGERAAMNLLKTFGVACNGVVGL